MIKNYGVDLEKELRERSEKDLIVGGPLPVPKGIADDIAGAITALHAWANISHGIYQRTDRAINHCVCSFRKKFAKYYPKGEVQNLGEDKMDCVARGFNNEIEYELNYLTDNNILSPETIAWGKKRGYLVGGRWILSNRIPAKGSGTTRNGNSLKAVIQWIHKNGIHPRSLLSEEGEMTWNEYHGFEMTKEFVDVGLESKKFLSINYAKVYASMFERFFGWFKWRIFDNYVDVVDGDFVKHLAEDYKFISYCYRVIINEGEAKKKIMKADSKFINKGYKGFFYRNSKDDPKSKDHIGHGIFVVMNAWLGGKEWADNNRALHFLNSTGLIKLFQKDGFLGKRYKGRT